MRKNDMKIHAIPIVFKKKNVPVPPFLTSRYFLYLLLSQYNFGNLTYWIRLLCSAILHRNNVQKLNRLEIEHEISKYRMKRNQL